MLPSDNAGAAAQASRLFDDPRVRQFYDGQRHVGWAYTRGPFAGAFRRAHAALPPDHPLRDSSRADREGPAWDAYFFHKPGATWSDSPPMPDHWLKQVGYNPAGPSVLFKNSVDAPPVEADLKKELREMAAELWLPSP